MLWNGFSVEDKFSSHQMTATLAAGNENTLEYTMIAESTKLTEMSSPVLAQNLTDDL